MTPSCPLCTFKRDRHPELSSDLYAFPVFSRGRNGAKWDEAHPEDVAKGNSRTRWLLVEGCIHARELDRGDWRSEAEIEGAWERIVQRLNEQKARVSQGV